MKTSRKVSGPAAARRRHLETLAATTKEPTSLEVAVASARGARLARERFLALEERTVISGREAGISWEELGRWLMCPGQTLRRRYGKEVD